jgi:hypothetical protein
MVCPMSGWTSEQKYGTKLYLHLPGDSVRMSVGLHASSRHAPVVTDAARDDDR